MKNVLPSPSECETKVVVAAGWLTDRDLPGITHFRVATPEILRQVIDLKPHVVCLGKRFCCSRDKKRALIRKMKDQGIEVILQEAA